MSSTIASGSVDNHPNQQSVRENRTLFNKVEYLWSLFVRTSTKATSRIRMDTLRPLPVFLGITGPTLCFDPFAFNPPTKKIDKATIEKIYSRLSLNFAYFMSNYALLFMGVTVVVSLMHLDMLIALLMVSTFWWFHVVTTKNSIPLIVGNVDIGARIPEHVRTLVLIVSTIFVSIYYCLLPLLCVLFISAILILTHAFMRDPKHVETTNAFSSRRYGSDNDLDDDSDAIDIDSMSEGVLVSRGDAV